MVSERRTIPEATSDVEAIERDLRALGEHRGGFDNPQPLADKLRCVLELRSVVEASGTTANSRVARVAALRSVLRGALRLINSESTRTVAGVLLFLLDDEELATLGVDPVVARGRLHTDRRPAIARLLRISVDALRKTEEPRVRALVAGELMRYELQTTDRVPPQAGTAGPPAITAAKTIRLALRDVYPRGARLSQLGACLVPDRPVFQNALVEMRLADDPADNARYLYELRLTFEAVLDEYVVAIVNRPHVLDEVMSEAHGITDLYVCAGERARREHAQNLCQASDALLAVDDVGRAPRRRGIRLALVPEADYTRYTGDAEETVLAQLTLLRADLRSYRSPEGSVRLQTKQRLILSKHEHFCFWLADRPTYVQRLRVDARELMLEQGDGARELSAQPFMLAGNVRAVFDRHQVMELQPDAWLLPGQGLAVSW